MYLFDGEAKLFMMSVNVIFAKNGRGAWFCVNNGRLSVDGGTAAMILFAT